MKKYNNRYNASLNSYIEVEPHAVERFKERLNRPDMDDKEVVQKIINQVRFSKLIDIKGNIEHRSHNGNVYVVARSFEKDVMGLLKDRVTVKTLKLSKVRIRENFSKDFDMRTVDIDRLLGTAAAC